MGHEQHHAPGRRAARVRVIGRAIVHGDHGVNACDVVDLSVGGMLLQCGPGMIPAVGEPVTVELHLSASKSRWYDLSATVCRRAAADRFVITIDRIPPDLEDDIEEELLAAVEAALAPRVVVVDAPSERRQRLAESVRRAACEPIVASTPLEAIRCIDESRTHASAVIVGQELTQTQASELVHYLHESHPEMRVALVHDPAQPTPELDDGVVVMAPGECENSARVYDLLGVLEPLKR